MATKCLGIVGVGLIGGSIGLAARRTKQFGTILGVDHDSPSLTQAHNLGCIDEGTTLDVAAERADVLVFCTPVDRIAELVVAAARHCRPDAILTDAGSTKVAIVAAIDTLSSPAVRFVGAHPLAGSEKHGCAAAEADLFDDHLTILTPTERTQAQAVDGSRRFWESLGCRVRLMSPEEHDRGVAVTSHLPHLLSALLAGMLPEALVELTASGFRDMTRLAAGDPAVWSAIFVQNRDNVLAALKMVQERLPKVASALTTSDATAIERLLADAKRIRDDLGD